MEFDFSKMTACDELFYGVVPDKAAYPIGRVCILVTFGTEENFRTEYLTFEVTDFRSSYHAIFGRPMLAKFMAIPHHTYLIMKMPVPNGIISILGDIMVSYNCESATVELSEDSAIKAAATIMVAQAAKIDQTTLQVPEQKRTSTALDPSPAVKKVCLGLPDASKEVVIGALLHEVFLRELVMWNRPSVLVEALECLRDSFRRILNKGGNLITQTLSFTQ
jgi:hypothetical protein